MCKGKNESVNDAGHILDGRVYSFIFEMENGNGSILLAPPPPIGHILASLDNVASAVDRIQKEA